MKGPPRARKRYPKSRPSKGSAFSNDMNRAPMARDKAPRIPQTRGP